MVENYRRQFWEYNFEYNENRNIVNVLEITLSIIISTFIPLILLIYNNKIIWNIFKNKIILIIAIIIVIFITLMIFILFYGYKKKNIHITVINDYIDINKGEEKIYFSEINEVTLITINKLRWGTIIGYTLNIRYKVKKNLNMTVRVSDKEEHNCKMLLQFYNHIIK